MNNKTGTVADAVVAGLIDHDIETLYCLPGVQNDDLFDALHRAQDRIAVIHTRHEQGAAYMALGAALATGKPAAFCVVPGPGILNTAAALCTAYACNAPVLALTGQIPKDQIGGGHGFLHELPNQLNTLRSLTKWADRVTGLADAQPLVNEAFRKMTQGRPRPVALECPIDVWGERGSLTFEFKQTVETPPADHHAIQQASSLLRGCERPLIVVGGGAQDSADLVRELSDLLQAPVLSNRMGRGIVDSLAPLSVNQTEGHRFWAEADLIIGIGTRLQQQLAWGTPLDTKIIRIDVDAEEISRFALPSVGLQGDASAVLAALLIELRSHGAIEFSRERDVVLHKEDIARELSQLVPQKQYLAAIRAALPAHGIFVDELTQVGYASRLLYPVHQPRTFITPAYQGTLGWGYATALGVKVARPEAPVISISGDGGFMFNVQELATAALHNIAVIAIVFDDAAFGNVRRLQKQKYGRNIATSLKNPDFVKLAESFDIKATRLDSPSDLELVLREAIASNQPWLIHVPVDEMPDPWRFINLPRLH